MQGIQIPISPAELIDKICILELKAEKISDPEKQKNIRHELETLRTVFRKNIAASPELDVLITQLKSLSRMGWDHEDVKRACEREHDFGPRFIAAARGAYTNNDERSAIWKQINVLLGSDIVQEKSHENL
jgi:hypothetical protein